MPATVTVNEDREAVLSALGGLAAVNSVELKMNVPSDQRSALRALQLDPLQGRIREVVFYDTPDLRLFRAGVVIRSRRTQGAKVDDTVVKLRPAPKSLPRDVRGSPNLKVEMDITRDGYVVSASLKGARPLGATTEALQGQRSIERLFTKEQRPFLEAHFPPDTGWDDLVPLGPIYVIVLKQTPRAFAHRLTIEQWHFPGQVPLVELSTKATPQTFSEVGAEARAFLEGCGLRSTGEQEPKTLKALQFFAPKPAKE